MKFPFGAILAAACAFLLHLTAAAPVPSPILDGGDDDAPTLTSRDDANTTTCDVAAEKLGQVVEPLLDVLADKVLEKLPMKELVIVVKPMLDIAKADLVADLPTESFDELVKNLRRRKS